MTWSSCTLAATLGSVDQEVADIKRRLNYASFPHEVRRDAYARLIELYKERNRALSEAK